MTGSVITARMFYSARFEKRFYTPIFPHSAVKRKKNRVGFFAKLNYSSADKSFSFAEVFFQIVEIRLGCRNTIFVFAFRTEHFIDFGCVYRFIYVRQSDGVSALHKCSGDQRSRRKGNVAFGTHASCKNDYFHKLKNLFCSCVIYCRAFPPPQALRKGKVHLWRAKALLP